MFIAETLTDLVLDQILTHAKLRSLIDERIDEKINIKLAALNISQPSIDGPGFLRPT